jgi:transposase family protein
LELFEFPDLKKPIEVSFTAPDLSSFGGLHLLHGVNLRQGFLTRLASHIMEWRNKDLIVHSLEEMLIQCVFQIAAGYEDADDCDTLRHDNMLKMCTGLLPNDGDLCSQPTMTRLENHVSRFL